MIVKSVNSENWIISWDNKNCYKLNKEQLGTHWILGFHGDQYFCCEPGFLKTVDILLREYQNEQILIGRKLVKMTKTEEMIMAAFATKLYGNAPTEMTRKNILKTIRTDPDKLSNRVIQRLVSRGLIEVVDKKYILLEKGKNYCHLYLINLINEPISISSTSSIVTLEVDDSDTESNPDLIQNQ